MKPVSLTSLKYIFWKGLSCKQGVLSKFKLSSISYIWLWLLQHHLICHVWAQTHCLTGDKHLGCYMVLTIPLPAVDWREQFIKYLSSAEVPADKTKTERLIHRSKHYVLVDSNLMRKSAKEGILQKCITQEDGVKLLLKIHSGSCGNHATSRTLVGKAFWAGFYWPTAIFDAEDLVRRCEGCQFFAKQIHVSAQELQTIPAS